jgi:hypothetical protein
MLTISARMFVVLALASVPITAGDASARTIRRSCRDGVSTHRANPDVSCDVGGQCDGICSFSVPVCGASTCQDETLAVPVGSTRRERIAVEPGAGPTTLVLRCRPTGRDAECVTVTTTTGGPTTTRFGHLPERTTTTSLGLVNGSSSTSSTTTSTSSSMPRSTSTSIMSFPCQTDADCDGLATACAVGVCRPDARCAQTCVCVTPDLDLTCSLDAATLCLTPDDCPELRDGACRVCYLNLCVTAPAPACFF